MSVSLQYHAARETPLTQSERDALLSCIAEHGEPEVEDPGESFGFYEFYAPHIKPWREHSLLNGSTGVRTDEEVNHWVALLAKCRRLVPLAQWSVNLDGEYYNWDESAHAYLLPVPPEPPTVEVSFTPDIEFSPEAFRGLVAQRAGCVSTDSDAKIAEGLRNGLDNAERILSICASTMAADRFEELRLERLMWAITGELSFPSFRTEWRINVEPTKD